MKSSTTSWYLCTIFIITLLFGAPILSWAKSPINKNWKGVAVKGYDPVAYFTVGTPMQGKKEFEYKWKGAKWRFSKAEHLDLFQSNPEKYAPQYGGY